jgi:predicted GIY-YIG superfamily endonuclease
VLQTALSGDSGFTVTIQREVLQISTSSIDWFTMKRSTIHAMQFSREKEIKGWRREKKNDLVRKLNPKWNDLGQRLFGVVGDVPRSARG